MENIKKGHIVLKAFVRLKIESLGKYIMINNLNKIMDEWYMHEKFIYKPTIINFWGINGSGKERLITRMKQMYKLDSHTINVDYRNKKSLVILKSELLELKERKHLNRLAVSFIGFNKIKISNNEERQFINDFIRLGIVKTIIPTKVKDHINELLIDLHHIINTGLVVKAGIVLQDDSIQGKLAYSNLIRRNRLTRYNTIFDKIDKPSGIIKNKYSIGEPISLVNEMFYKSLVDSSDFFNEEELKNKLHTLNAKQTLLLIEDIATNTHVSHQFFNTLILTHNELDYEYVEQMNNEIDLDNIGSVRLCLKKDFDSEMFRSLGQHHLIFPNFKTETFEKLIRDRLEMMVDYFDNKQNVKIEFDKSVNSFFADNYIDTKKGATPVVKAIEKVLLYKLNSTLKRKKNKSFFVKIVNSKIIIDKVY